MLNEKRFLKISLPCWIVSAISIFAFSNKLNYSIIFSLGFIIGVIGYIVLIRTVDRCLRKGKGQFLFFIMAFLKMAAITGGFFLAAWISRTAVFLYILGLLFTIAAIMAHALFLICRSIFKWKNTN